MTAMCDCGLALGFVVKPQKSPSCVVILKCHAPEDSPVLKKRSRFAQLEKQLIPTFAKARIAAVIAKQSFDLASGDLTIYSALRSLRKMYVSLAKAPLFNVYTPGSRDCCPWLKTSKDKLRS